MLSPSAPAGAGSGPAQPRRTRVKTKTKTTKTKKMSGQTQTQRPMTIADGLLAARRFYDALCLEYDLELAESQPDLQGLYEIQQEIAELERLAPWLKPAL